MKTYTVEIHTYPKVLTVVADSNEAAREIARALFHEESDESIYETIVTED